MCHKEVGKNVLSFSPDDKTLIYTENTGTIIVEKNGAKILTVETDAIIKTLDSGSTPTQAIVAFSPDGSRVALGYSDGDCFRFKGHLLKICEAATGKELTNLDGQPTKKYGRPTKLKLHRLLKAFIIALRQSDVPQAFIDQRLFKLVQGSSAFCLYHAVTTVL
jgi:hypothetical protein